jgi:hypothetical protein
MNVCRWNRRRQTSRNQTRPSNDRPESRRRLSVASELVRQLGVPRAALQKDAGRGLPWVVFRELGMALTAKLTKQSLNEIGRLFGGLDHSTVLSGKRAMAAILKQPGSTK